MEAMRCLKRRLSDLVYRQMVNDAKANARKISLVAGGDCAVGAVQGS
jgi:hypothetical protein